MVLSSQRNDQSAAYACDRQQAALHCVNLKPASVVRQVVMASLQRRQRSNVLFYLTLTCVTTCQHSITCLEQTGFSNLKDVIVKFTCIFERKTAARRTAARRDGAFKESLPIFEQGQRPDCILCMIWQSPSPGHPSAADEAWYWPKRVLRSG